MDAHSSSLKAILYAFLANFAIAIAKGTAAFLTGSGSMMAETIHSVADCGNQALLYYGIKRAQRPATKEYPLGFGKAVYFWSFIVALMLFSLGGLFSACEGIHKILQPEPISKPQLALGILGFSIVLEGFSLLGAIKETRKIMEGKKVAQWIKSTRNAELLVVLGEDFAAITGLVFAFIFILLSWITGNPVYDSIGSVIIGVILLLISFFLMNRIQALLIGRSAEPEIAHFIAAQISKDKNIEEIYNIITMHMGAQVMLAAKIRMNEKLSIKQACIAINKLEEVIHKEFPEIKWTFIEPDIEN
ncbi:MAG: cation diffusion facilitator family transporter [Spirochaetia bacterium]|nr:cation diffusion facilitator family transporter [Spirochaetia bacterium]